MATMVAVAVGTFIPAAPAGAHETGATLLTVTTTEQHVRFDAQVPLHRLEIALGTELTDDPSVVVGLRPTLVALFQTKVAVDTPDGSPWSLSVDALGLTSVDKVDHLQAQFTATPPDGAATNAFRLRYEVVNDVIYTHNTYVAAAATDGGTPTLLGTINHYHPSLVVGTVDDHHDDTSFRSMLSVGTEHFREGIDHLLFVVLVALAAFVRQAGFRSTVRTLAMLTVAFTLGHSISLTLAMLQVVTPPSQLVETGIAVTILVSAIHIARPLVPERLEAATTFTFGLIHGFGFAGTLGGLSLRGMDILLPTLGFNLGLELAQLAALALIAGPLWILGRSRLGQVATAALVGAVAVSWIAQRAIGAPNPLEPIVAFAAGSPERLTVTLLTAAGAVMLSRRQRFNREALRSQVDSGIRAKDH